MFPYCNNTISSLTKFQDTTIWLGNKIIHGFSFTEVKLEYFCLHHNFQNFKAIAQIMENILELKVQSENFWMWPPLSTEEFNSKQNLGFRKLIWVFKWSTCMKAIQCTVIQIALAKIVKWSLHYSKCFDSSKQNNNEKL